MVKSAFVPTSVTPEAPDHNSRALPLLHGVREYSGEKVPLGDGSFGVVFATKKQNALWQEVASSDHFEATQ